MYENSLMKQILSQPNITAIVLSSVETPYHFSIESAKISLTLKGNDRSWPLYNEVYCPQLCRGLSE